MSLVITLALASLTLGCAGLADALSAPVTEPGICITPVAALAQAPSSPPDSSVAVIAAAHGYGIPMPPRWLADLAVAEQTVIGAPRVLSARAPPASD